MEDRGAEENNTKTDFKKRQVVRMGDGLNWPMIMTNEKGVLLSYSITTELVIYQLHWSHSKLKSSPQLLT
jgi:hypothetical protein